MPDNNTSSKSGPARPGFWKRNLDRIGIGGSFFAALCCLGFPVSTTEAKALEADLADSFERRYITPKQERSKKHGEELLKVAQAHLDKKGVAAFQEAIARGYRPVSNEI